MEPFADFVMSSGELVWVSGAHPGIAGYDSSMSAAIGVPAGEVRAALEFGHGAIWAAEATEEGEPMVTLLKIDAASGEATRFPVAGPGIPDESSIAVTDDGVWVIVPPHDGEPWTLLGIDPETGAESGRVDLGTVTVAAVRGGFGSLWVTRPSGLLGRYDPATGELQAEIALPRSSTFLSVGPDAVWVMDQAGGVTRVDPETDAVVTTIDAAPDGIRGGDIVATGDAVWVQANSRLAVQIDPATNEVVQRLLPAEGSGGVAVTDDGAVWITAHDVLTLYRIPPG